VFFFVVGMAMRVGLASGLLTVLAVTVVDYLYIALAVLGIGKLLEKPRARRIMGIAGSIVLVAFGAFMLGSALRDGTGAGAGPGAAVGTARGGLEGFLAALLLTLSSPLTVVFWTGLFAARAAEKGYTKKQLVVFGLSAGLATPVFLGVAVVVFSAARSWIPPGVIHVLNAAVGGVLAAWGVARLAKLLLGRPRGQPPAAPGGPGRK
jgi:threonine/homoserine/homoserine lactone efflux protein